MKIIRHMENIRKNTSIQKKKNKIHRCFFLNSISQLLIEFRIDTVSEYLNSKYIYFFQKT